MAVLRGSAACYERQAVCLTECPEATKESDHNQLTAFIPISSWGHDFRKLNATGKSQIKTNPPLATFTHSENSKSSRASKFPALAEVATMCRCIAKADTATTSTRRPLSINWSFHCFIILEAASAKKNEIHLPNTEENMNSSSGGVVGGVCARMMPR